jgi:membrane fusion protein, multidrug efflux system
MTQRRAKWLVLIAVLLVVAIVPFLMMSTRNGNGANQGGAPAGPQGGPPAFAMPAMPVEVAAVIVGPVTDTVSAVGNLEANESVMIRPEILGRITRINFQEGQAVEKGRVLIELDPASSRRS